MPVFSTKDGRLSEYFTGDIPIYEVTCEWDQSPMLRYLSIGNNAPFVQRGVTKGKLVYNGPGVVLHPSLFTVPNDYLQFDVTLSIGAAANLTLYATPTEYIFTWRYSANSTTQEFKASNDIVLYDPEFNPFFVGDNIVDVCRTSVCDLPPPSIDGEELNGVTTIVMRWLYSSFEKVIGKEVVPGKQITAKHVNAGTFSVEIDITVQDDQFARSLGEVYTLELPVNQSEKYVFDWCRFIGVTGAVVSPKTSRISEVTLQYAYTANTIDNNLLIGGSILHPNGTYLYQGA